jgi:hypothetical protein
LGLGFRVGIKVRVLVSAITRFRVALYPSLNVILVLACGPAWRMGKIRRARPVGLGCEV